MIHSTNSILLRQDIAQDSNIPILPPGIVYLLKALNDDDILYADLAVELEKFPSIAIKIVAIANSAWALPSMPITNLHDACARIGLNIVRSVSIALSISHVFDPSKCSSFDTKTFWTSALLNAESAFLCAKDHPDIDPNTARFAGLLHNIGLLWLANQKPVETAIALSSSQEDGHLSIAQSLNEQLGMDHHSIGGLLATSMELPDTIVDAISTGTLYNINNESPLIHNHCHAKKLTTSVLKHKELEDDEHALPEDDDPHYKKLADILPKIQTMADAIFIG